MRNHDLISSSVLLCFGIAVVAYSFQFGIGTPNSPRSGFWPLLTGVVICVFAAATFLVALRRKSASVENIWGGVRLLRLGFGIVALLAYGVLLTKVGFIVCSLLLLVILLRCLGSQTWRITFVVACTGTAISYMIFESWLKANLPRGPLGF